MTKIGKEEKVRIYDCDVCGMAVDAQRAGCGSCLVRFTNADGGSRQRIINPDNPNSPKYIAKTAEPIASPGCNTDNLGRLVVGKLNNNS